VRGVALLRGRGVACGIAEAASAHPMSSSAPPPVSPVASAAAALLYGGTAVALAFVNKAVLSLYGFKESNVMLLLQMLTAAASVSALRARGVIDAAPLTLARARTLTPIAALYCSNTAFALASLDGLSVPMYTTLKRLTPACVLLAQAVGGRPPSRAVAASVGVTMLGCVLAGAGDLGFDAKAYSFAGASCGLQTAYLMAVERARTGLSSWELLLYNSLLSAPILLLLCLADGELGRAAITLPALLRGPDALGFAATFGAALLLGVQLNFAIFLCTRVNSALTTTVVGIMKGVCMTLLGFLLLGGVRDSTPLLLGGIALNTAGGVWYAMLEYREKQARKRAATLAAAAASAAADAEAGVLKAGGDGGAEEGDGGVVAREEAAGRELPSWEAAPAGSADTPRSAAAAASLSAARHRA
jgi:solute carrier family 35 protein